MPNTIDTAIYGMGPIGRGIAVAALRKQSFNVVGAVDISPELAGRNLAELLEGGGPDAKVVSSLDDLLAYCSPSVVFHATGSYLGRVRSQFEELIRAGLTVVSTCEDASFPSSDEAKRILPKLDSLCKAHGARLLATGINPGFAMDIWPLVVSASRIDYDRISITRVVDARTRREPLQRKVGPGLAPEEFHRLVAEKAIGHVGLSASADMLAHGLGCRILQKEESIDPVIASTEVKTDYFLVKPGQVSGLCQKLTCALEGGKELVFRLEMYLGAPDPRDEVHIEGSRDSFVSVQSGFPGDQATAAVITNAAPALLRLAPGYHTMLDLPFFGCAL